MIEVPTYLVVAVASACCSALALVLLLGLRDRLPEDIPNARSLHASPTPRIGGIALVPVAMIVAVMTDQPSSVVAVTLGCMLPLFIVSVLDDFSGASIWIRFTVHFIVAGAFCAWELGPTITLLPVALLVIWCINLFNFMDGANGLAGGMAVFGFGALGLASEQFQTLPWAVSGAAAGFLIFNFHPARVFLGDAGSIPLGFLAGAIGVSGVVAGSWPWWFPVLVFFPFFIDATATLLRRALRRERVWEAHREHYYQRLVQLGWSHRRLAITEYAAMLVSAGMALILLRMPDDARIYGLGLVVGSYAVAMIWIDRQWKRRVAE